MFSAFSAFLQAPFPARVLNGKQASAPCVGQRSSYSTGHRVGSRRGHPVRCQLGTPGKEKDSQASFAALEEEIREYLDTCTEPGPSPLSYVSLGNAGRTDLVSRIMEFGGYIKVSERLGIPVDESQFIPPPSISDSGGNPIFTKYEDGASLTLGRDLEARLKSAEEVMKGSSGSADDIATVRTRDMRQWQEVPSAEQIRLENESFLPPVVDEPVPEGERMILTGSMRVGLLLLAAISALGYGHASNGIISEDTIAACRTIAGCLGVAHVFVAVYAGLVLAPQSRRNPFLWSVKVLLSGPIGIRYLRSLGTL